MLLKWTRYLLAFAVLLAAVFPIAQGSLQKAAAATEKTMVIKLPATGDSTTQKQTGTVTIPKLKRIVSTTANTGDATSAISGNTVTITANNGTKVRNDVREVTDIVDTEQYFRYADFYGTSTDKPTIPSTASIEVDRQKFLKDWGWKTVNEYTVTGKLVSGTSSYFFSTNLDTWIGSGQYVGRVTGTKEYRYETPYYAYEVTIKYIDNTDPTINVTTANNQVLSEVQGYNTLAVTGTTQDEDVGDIVSVKYTIDGIAAHTGKTVATITSNGANQAFGPFNITINSTIPEGVHTLRVWSEDNKGGKSSEVTRTFKVDKTPPVAPTFAETPPGRAAAKTITITYSGDSFKKEYQIGSGSWVSYTGALTIKQNGTINARATDDAGNQTTASYEVKSINPPDPKPSISQVKETNISVQDDQVYGADPVERQFSIYETGETNPLATSSWTNDSKYEFSSLLPNKKYTVKIDVRFK